MNLLPRLRILKAKCRRDDGQSLLETALSIPLLLGLAFNVINLASLWFMVLVLSSASRSGVEYASQGGAASGAPTDSAVQNMIWDNMVSHVRNATTSNVAVRVCTVT